MMNEETSNPFQVTLMVFGSITQIYLAASLLLFAVMTYCCTLILDWTEEQVKRSNDDNVEVSLFDSCKMLEVLKRRLHLICDVITAIDNSFGLTLLFSIGFFYLTLVTQSFYIFNGIVDGVNTSKFLVDGSYLVYYTILLSLICIPVDFLQFKVHWPHKYLN